MPRCPGCTTEYADDLDACPECGWTRESIRCARCGEEFEGSDACPACGRASVELTCERHPESTADARCVICARALCRICQRGERAYMCADHAAITVIQGWAQIYSTASEFEAQLLRENLLAEGIDAQIFSQKDNMLSVDLGELSIVRLLVPVWEYEQASKIIREHMDPEGEVAFACPACGEAYELGAESCASCGAVLVPGVSD